MAVKLGSAYGKVSLDVNGLLSAVKQGKAGMLTLAQAGQNLGMTMKSAGQSLTLGLTLPIVALGGAAIKAASDFEETKNKAVVVFGEMADSVVANAERAAETLGMSMTQYLDYASTIGAALTAGGMGVKEATELSEQAVKHFADLMSFHNTTVEDAAMAWQSAIRGQFEPIQKYFPFITDQFLKTYGTANGLIDASTKQLTANQRAIILNAIALDEKLNPAMNDFAETSGSLANSTRTLQGEFVKALILLGQNLLPIALQFVKILNAMLTSFNNLSPGMQKAILVFLGLLALLGPVLSFVGTIVSIVSGLVGLAGTLTTAGISLSAIATALGTAATAIVGMAAAALTVILPLLLIAATVYLVYLAFKNNFMGITTTAKQLWFIIKWVFGQIAQTITAFFKYIQSIIETDGNFLNDWLSHIPEALRPFVRAFGETFAKVREVTIDFFSRLRNISWADIGKMIIWGLANGMLMGIPSLIAAAAKAAQAVLKEFDDKFDFGSPSKVMEKRGLWSGQGWMRGWNYSMDPKAVSQMMAKPILNQTSSSQANVAMHFASGVTIRQVQEMLNNNNEQLLGQLNRALGGA